MVLRIQACHDAHIALMERPGNDTLDTYEIVIGGWENTKSAIRDQKMGPLKIQVDSPKVLDCDEFRTFWLGWEMGMIRVGKGTFFGKDEIMSWQDPMPYDVNAVSLASGFEASATWRVDLEKGKFIMIKNAPHGRVSFSFFTPEFFFC